MEIQVYFLSDFFLDAGTPLDFFDATVFDFEVTLADLVVATTDLPLGFAAVVFGLVPTASFLEVTLEDGLLVLVATLTLGATVFFLGGEATFGVVVFFFGATVLVTGVFLVAAEVFLTVADLGLDAPVVGASGFLDLVAVAVFLAAVFGAGFAFSLEEGDASRGALGASLTLPAGPLGRANTFFSLPVLIALLILAMTPPLTSIL